MNLQEKDQVKMYLVDFLQKDLFGYQMLVKEVIDFVAAFVFPFVVDLVFFLLTEFDPLMV